MKKLLTAAALGMFCLSGMAQEAKDGFEFTVVKANPVTSVKTRAVPVLAGATLHWHSSNQNCSVWARVNTTSLKCSSFTILTWIVQTRQCALTVMYHSLRVVLSTMHSMVWKSSVWFLKQKCVRA